MTEAPDRRDELLGRIIDVLLRKGVSDLSLRPLAASVGSSARLLIYHFGSKEQLLTVALKGIRQRIEASIHELTTRQRPDDLPAFLRMFWNWALLETSQRYFRLIFEIGGVAMQNKDKFPDEFWGGAGLVAWIHSFEREFKELSTKKGGAGAATFVIAALNGLIRDLIATQDRKRTTEGVNYLIAIFSEQKSTTRSAGRKKA
jgi:AcrR family transcriptional regulator